MGRTSSVELHPRKGELLRRLELKHIDGESFADIAADFENVSDDSLERYYVKHVLPELRKKLQRDVLLSRVDPLAEMRRLYHRINVYLDKAEENEDLPAIKAFHSEARADLKLLTETMMNLGLHEPQSDRYNPLMDPHFMVFMDKLRRLLAPHPELQDAAARILMELEEDEASDGGEVVQHALPSA